MNKKYMSLNAIILSISYIATSAFSGPFGMEKGMTLEAVQRLGKFDPIDSKYVYRAKNLKSGHPDFELYSVIITPLSGLCKISLVSKDVETNSYGSELSSKYSELKGTLSGKYGPVKMEYDFLMSGSIWKNSNEWMMSLRQKERTLAAFWDKKTSSLNDSLSGISLEAKALSQNKGYIILSYEFDNIDACIAERSAANNSNL